MSMSVGPAEGGDSAPMSDINTTPLVDVMLVLLIIFLITVPVVIQTVPLKLPKQSNVPTATKPENVLISVTPAGEVFWGLQRMESSAELREKGAANLKREIARLEASGAPVELPEVHIRADAGTEYKNVGGVIFAMQRAGYQKIGFISEPPPNSVTR